MSLWILSLLGAVFADAARPSARLRPGPVPSEAWVAENWPAVVDRPRVRPSVLLPVAYFLAKQGLEFALTRLATHYFLSVFNKNPAAWRLFWEEVIRRAGLSGTLAASLIVADGPLPAGDLIAAGLTLWMIYDLLCVAVELADTLSEEP